eukprot:g26319.t1
MEKMSKKTDEVNEGNEEDQDKADKEGTAHKDSDAFFLTFEFGNAEERTSTTPTTSAVCASCATKLFEVRQSSR